MLQYQNSKKLNLNKTVMSKKIKARLKRCVRSRAMCVGKRKKKARNIRIPIQNDSPPHDLHVDWPDSFVTTDKLCLP